jgi:hypothetical protein
MHRRQSQPRSFGTTLAVAALVLAAAYQLFTRGLPGQFSAEAAKITSTYDAAATDVALDLFRSN